jgi:hypothetical protein
VLLNSSGDSYLNGGNVGIGETSPDYRLHVNSAATNIVAKFESTDGTAGIMLLDSAGNVELSASGNNFQVQPAGGAAKLIITSAGNAHLSGQIDARMQLSSSGGANTVSDNTVYVRGNDDTAILNSAANGDIKLSENGTTRLFIKRSTGSVGIGTGTGTPVSLLEVMDADTSGNFQGITTTNTGISNAKSGIAFKAYDWVQSAIYHHRGTAALILGTNPDTTDLSVGGVVPRIIIENDGTVIQKPSTGSGQSETRILARVTPNYPGSGQVGTAQNWYSPAIGESGIIHFGNTNNAGGEYRCAGYIVFSRAQSGGAMTIAVTESIGGNMVAFAVSGANITVQNTYGYGIELMGRVESFRRA